MNHLVLIGIYDFRISDCLDSHDLCSTLKFKFVVTLIITILGLNIKLNSADYIHQNNGNGNVLKIHGMFKMNSCLSATMNC